MRVAILQFIFLAAAICFNFSSSRYPWPHRVARWLPKEVGTPTDLWIDTIPFAETRRYVRRVMAHTIACNNGRGDQRGRMNHYLTPLPLHADSKVALVTRQ
jgi:hypothetical protein